MNPRIFCSISKPWLNSIHATLYNRLNFYQRKIPNVAKAKANKFGECSYDDPMPSVLYDPHETYKTEQKYQLHVINVLRGITTVYKLYNHVMILL